MGKAKMKYPDVYGKYAPEVMALYRGHRFERLVLEKIEGTGTIIPSLGIESEMTDMTRCMYKRLLIGLGATALPYILLACPDREVAAEVLGTAATVAMHTGMRSAVIAAAETHRRLIGCPRLEEIVNDLAKRAQSGWHEPSLAAESITYMAGYYLKQNPHNIVLYGESCR